MSVSVCLYVCLCLCVSVSVCLCAFDPTYSSDCSVVFPFSASAIAAAPSSPMLLFSRLRDGVSGWSWSWVEKNTRHSGETSENLLVRHGWREAGGRTSGGAKRDAHTQTRTLGSPTVVAYERSWTLAFRWSAAASAAAPFGPMLFFSRLTPKKHARESAVARRERERETDRQTERERQRERERGRGEMKVGQKK